MGAPKKPKQNYATYNVEPVLKTFQLLLVVGARQLPITWIAKAETKEKAIEDTVGKLTEKFRADYGPDVYVVPYLVEEL